MSGNTGDSGEMAMSGESLEKEAEKETEKQTAGTKKMTWREALRWGKTQLLEAEIPDGPWDAEHLFEFTVGCGRTELLLYGDRLLSEKQRTRYAELIGQRKNHVPFQYLTGEQEFMGLPFYVNPNVLIPRQDTECLVEIVQKELERTCGMRTASDDAERKGGEPDGKAAEPEQLRILDLCTGSGCIGISIAKRMEGTARVETVCSDISEKALEVAKRNAERNGVEVTLTASDLFEKITGKFHIIVSNPPYVTKAEMEELMPEVRLFEPEEALYGREDGLFFYREIVRRAAGFLEKDGKLFFEIGCRQGREVSGLMARAGFRDIRIEKDLAGLDRVVYGRM